MFRFKKLQQSLASNIVNTIKQKKPLGFQEKWSLKFLDSDTLRDDVMKPLKCSNQPLSSWRTAFEDIRNNASISTDDLLEAASSIRYGDAMHILMKDASGPCIKRSIDDEKNYKKELLIKELINRLTDDSQTLGIPESQVVETISKHGYVHLLTDDVLNNISSTQLVNICHQGMASGHKKIDETIVKVSQNLDQRLDQLNLSDLLSDRLITPEIYFAVTEVVGLKEFYIQEIKRKAGQNENSQLVTTIKQDNLSDRRDAALAKAVREGDKPKIKIIAQHHLPSPGAKFKEAVDQAPNRETLSALFTALNKTFREGSTAEHLRIITQVSNARNALTPTAPAPA